MNNGVSECLARPGVHSRGLKCTPGERTPWYQNISKGLQANDVSARPGIYENRWHGGPPGEMPWRSKNLKAQRAGFVSVVRLALRNAKQVPSFPVSHRPLPPGKWNTCNAPATERTIELVLAAVFNIPIDLSYAEKILYTRKLAAPISMSNRCTACS